VDLSFCVCVSLCVCALFAALWSGDRGEILRCGALRVKGGRERERERERRCDFVTRWRLHGSSWKSFSMVVGCRRVVCVVVLV